MPTPSLLLFAACGAMSGDSAAELDPLPPFDALPAQAEPPDPFVSFPAGEPIEGVDDWEARRAPEVRRLFEHYVHGYAPAAVGVTGVERARHAGALGGVADVVELTVSIGAVDVHVVEFVPAGQPGPFPVMLGLNKCGNHTVSDAVGVAVPTSWPDPDCGADATAAGVGSHAAEWDLTGAIAAGVAVVTVAQSDLDPDDHDSAAREGRLRDSFDPDAAPDHAWGTIAAWAWGLSRVLDALEDRPELDLGRVLAFGHSRRGKTALWAAATDARIGAVWAHQSGIVGAALVRGSTGETLAANTTLFPHWFAPQLAAFGGHEDRLPVDQHLLLALVAPRPVLVTDGDDDAWANPAGAAEAVALSAPVWALYGEPGASWSTRPGDHAMTVPDWTTALAWWADNNP